ncbi:MAG TPA: hypothetical protein DCM08_07785 [Microscillaceae bacterium]|nr:hypothetical protein [Microscillaceae bacterium]
MKPKDEQKQEAIQQAALQCIFEEGIAGLKMESIAKKAQVATGTVYVYFKNKDELINHLFLRFKRSSILALEAQIDVKQPFKVNFRQLWYSYMNFALTNPAQATLLEQLHRSPYLSQEARQEAEKLLEPIRQLLNEGKQQQLVKPVDNELLLAFLSGSINQLARRSYEMGFELTPLRLEQAFAMAWDGIKS